MHSLLETYLSEVNAHLCALPPKRRADELREMRTHLENAIVVSHELGRSEAEAAANAVAQFGAAPFVGVGVVTAWRRGRTLDQRDFWGAAMGAVVVALLVTRLTPHLQAFLLPTPVRGFVQPPFTAWLWAWWAAWLMPTFLLVGGISGFLFPRRAAPGVAAGLTVFLAYFLLADIFVNSRWMKTSQVPIFDGPYWLSSIAVMDTIFILSAVAAAWAARQWRVRRAGRMALA